MTNTIAALRAREVDDSRGNPTVETDVITSSDHQGRAIVPSGASTGDDEALELRDGEKRRGGKGVRQAITNVLGPLSKVVSGMNVFDQAAIDNAMNDADGTPNKKVYGANAILSISMASLHAAANASKLPLYLYVWKLNNPKEVMPEELIFPLPMMNMINGGEHANNSIDMQEAMIQPKYGAFDDLLSALDACSEVQHCLAKRLDKAGHGTSVGDEGGFAPNLDSDEEAFQLLNEAVRDAGYEGKFNYCIDAAATEFYNKDTGLYAFNGADRTSEEMVQILEDWISKYPIISVEDWLADTDHDGWKLLTDRLGKKLQLVGDDLFCTNPRILQEGIDKGLANALLVKVNQIGTVTETLAAVAKAVKAEYKCVMSHRSGESEDTTIADLAVALCCGQIKTGGYSRSDRIAKYNQLRRIWEDAKERGIICLLGIAP